MALKWVLSSAYNIVIGQSADTADCRNSSCKINNKFSCDDHGKIIIMKERDKKYGMSGFQMPLHYPRYRKADYENMEEWKLDLLLQEYGLNFHGDDLEEKKKFAMGAFLWPDQI